MNLFDYRWCIKALKRCGRLPPSVRHFNMQLYQSIHDFAKQLYGHSEVMSGMLVTRAEPVSLRHGLHYALLHQRNLLLQDNAPGSFTIPSETLQTSHTASRSEFASD